MKRKLITYYLLFGILFLFPLKINGLTLDLKDWEDTYALDSYLDLAIDETNTVSFEQIQSGTPNLNFQKLAKWKEAFKAGKTYWGKIQIANYSPSDAHHIEWVLNFSINFTDIVVYAVDNLVASQVNNDG